MNRIEKQVLLRAPRSRVWRALTTASEFSAWFGHELLDDFAPGAVIRAKVNWEGRNGIEPFFVVEKIEPETLFSFRWAPDELDPKTPYADQPKTLVEFRLEEVPGGTLMTHSESGYDRIPGERREWLFRNDHGWTEQLLNIERYLAGKRDELSNQIVEVNVEDRVQRPVAVVFEAIVDPAKLAGYFITRGSAAMTTGATIEWEFDDGGAKLAVEVVEVVRDRTIVFDWTASGSKARVTIRLAADGDATKLAITESSWRMTTEGVKRALDQTRGWTDFACCLKAYLQHGVNLRAGRGAQ